MLALGRVVCWLAGAGAFLWMGLIWDEIGFMGIVCLALVSLLAAIVGSFLQDKGQERLAVGEAGKIVAICVENGFDLNQTVVLRKSGTYFGLTKDDYDQAFMPQVGKWIQRIKSDKYKLLDLDPDPDY